MTMVEAIKTCISKYLKFDGRARRKEYWYFFLFNALIELVLIIPAAILLSADSGSTLAIIIFVVLGIYSLFVFLPGLSVTVRRLHDVGKSGASIFISLIPAVGEIILFIWLIEDSEYGTNKYGENPKNVMPAWQRNLGRKSDLQQNSPAVQKNYREPVSVHGNQQNYIQNNVSNLNGNYQNKNIPNRQQDNIKFQQQKKEEFCRVFDKNNISRRLIAVCTGGSIAGRGAEGSWIYIGRDTSRCQIVFPDAEPGVSRLHCLVRIDGNLIELIDLNSSYGTFLQNGYRIPPNIPISLKAGDNFYLAAPYNNITVNYA